MNTAFDETGVDILLGIGGAPEGVLAAAALKCLGGEIQGKLVPSNDEEIARCEKMGIADIDKVFYMDDLCSGDDAIFAATGVTDGELLKGRSEERRVGKDDRNTMTTEDEKYN